MTAVLLAPPAFLTLSTISSDEQAMIQAAIARLARYRLVNDEAESFYEGSFTVQQFGISIPPSMLGVSTPTGWAGTVVDRMEERLDWLGWLADGDDLGLSEVYDDNGLDVDGGLAHLDSLIFGVSFVSVGSGFEGEPDVMVSAHSPKSMTGTWDARSRRLSSAVFVERAGSEFHVTTYQPDETARYVLRDGRWDVADRDRHRMGRVPVVMMPNRTRASRDGGRSEITRDIRYYCQAAARTLLGMEVSREFYNSPKIAALNVDESMFKDESGAKISQWTAIMGRVWSAPPNAPGDPEPKIQQIPAASPAPYLDQIRGYATNVAAAAGIPVSQFGFATENPPSADAIRAAEAPLVKRTERRQATLGRAWLEVGRLALMVRDGEIPDDFNRRFSAKWRDAATPTRAASADEAAKLIGAGVLPSDSTVTYDRIGLSPAEQRTLTVERRKAEGAAAVRDALRAVASEPNVQPAG